MVSYLHNKSFKACLPETLLTSEVFFPANDRGLVKDCCNYQMGFSCKPQQNNQRQLQAFSPADSHRIADLPTYADMLQYHTAKS